MKVIPMKRLIFLVGITAVFIYLNGCADQDKRVDASTSVINDAKSVAQNDTNGADVITGKDIEDAPAEITEKTTATCPEDCGKDCCYVVVTVNGEKVKEKEIADRVQRNKEMMKKRMIPGMKFPPNYSLQVRKQVVDQKVQQILQGQEMAKRNLTISDEQVLEELEKFTNQMGQSLEEAEKEFAKSGNTLEDALAEKRRRMQIDMLLKDQGVDMSISEEEAREFYDENPRYFVIQPQVQASHIFIRSESNATDEQKAVAQKKAQDILKQIKDGNDFAELAREYSDDPSSAKEGGDLGWIGPNQMAARFTNAAFKMEVGDISDVVEASYGCHIIKLTGKKPRGMTPFDEVRERIIQRLQEKKKNEAWLAFNKVLHDNATIQYSVSEQALRQEYVEYFETPRSVPEKQTTANPAQVNEEE